MASKATSISIANLSAAAHAASKAALEKAQLVDTHPEPGLLYNYPWIIGIIFREQENADLGKYQRVSEHVTEALNPQPLPPRRISCTYIYDHVIICGFRPVDEEPILLD